MAEDSHSADEIQFDEKDSSRYTPEAQDHFFKAVTHHAGHGPHPGVYSPLKELVEESGAEAEPEEKGPVPPSEALGPQPPISGGKGEGSAKPPSAGTPTAIGHEAAASPPAEGEF